VREQTSERSPNAAKPRIQGHRPTAEAALAQFESRGRETIQKILGTVNNARRRAGQRRNCQEPSANSNRDANHVFGDTPVAKPVFTIEEGARFA